MGSQAVFAALELGLFTELHAGPAPLVELADGSVRAAGAARRSRGVRAISDASFVGVTARPHVPDITYVFPGRRA
jgi:hypothetical protein